MDGKSRVAVAHTSAWGFQTQIFDLGLKKDKYFQRQLARFIIFDSLPLFRYIIFLPKQARFHIPGVLHHIMNRGSNRSLIFLDDQDRKRFLYRP
jgi:hypothetical protein